MLASRPAFAAPANRASIAGTVQIPTAAPSEVTLTYTVSVVGTVGAAVLTAHEPSSLPADPSSVQIDGTPASPGTVTAHSADLVVRLGVGANSSGGGQLVNGTVHVSFTLAVSRLPEPNTTVSADLAYTAGSESVTAHSADVALTDPDVSLVTPPDSGEDSVLPLGTDVDGDFEAILQNSGADSPATTLTVDLPAGLTVDTRTGVFRDDDYLNEDDDGGVQLRCTVRSSAQVTCALGAVPNGTNSLLDIPVQALPSAHVGRVAHFTVQALADTGRDADPGNNEVGASVQYTGTANLTVTLTPAKARVVLGKKVHVTATVLNDGPQPALNAIGIVAIDTAHFTITHFTGATVPYARAERHSHGLAALHRRSHRAQAAPVAYLGSPVVLWNVGTIKAGHSVTAVVTLRALSRGRTILAAFAGSDAGQPTCQDLSDLSKCTAIALTRLTAIAAPKPKPKPRPTPSTPSAASSSPALAATGAPDSGPLTAVGLLLLFGGGGLVALGSARRRSSARH